MMIFGMFLIAGIANPSPDPITMLILGGACVVLVEVAELIVWLNDRRRARLHPDPYAGLADDELSPIDLNGLDDGLDDVGRPSRQAASTSTCASATWPGTLVWNP